MTEAAVDMIDRCFENLLSAMQVNDKAYGVRQTGAGGNILQSFEQQLRRIIQAERRGDQRGKKHLSVNTVSYVTQPGIPPGQGCRPARVARAYPAPDVGADLRPDPLPVGIVYQRGLRRREKRQRIEISHPLGGKAGQHRHQGQPGLGNIFAAEIPTVVFQNPQVDHRVIHIIVFRHANDVLAQRLFSAVTVPGISAQQFLRNSPGGDVVR